MYHDSPSYVQVDLLEMESVVRIAAENYKEYYQGKCQAYLSEMQAKFNKNRYRWWRVFRRGEWTIEDTRKYLVKSFDSKYLSYACYDCDREWDLFRRVQKAAKIEQKLFLTLWDYETIRTWFEHKPRKVEDGTSG
jgi:hypothetical protein